jgi:hypothetical protein
VMGLALHLSIFDFAGTAGPDVPPAFLTPISDLHAQLLKVDGGEIVAIEEVVRRVPYGQSSPWDPPP